MGREKDCIAAAECPCMKIPIIRMTNEAKQYPNQKRRIK